MNLLKLLKSFVAISSGGFIVKIVSVGFDPAIDTFVKSISVVSPLAGLIALVLVIISDLEDIADARKKGVVGLAVFSFQFMPLIWVLGVWVVGLAVHFIVVPIVRQLINAFQK